MLLLLDQCSSDLADAVEQDFVTVISTNLFQQTLVATTTAQMV